MSDAYHHPVGKPPEDGAYLQRGTDVQVGSARRSGRVHNVRHTPSGERLYGIRFTDPTPQEERKRKGSMAVDCYARAEDLTLRESNVSFGGE